MDPGHRDVNPPSSFSGSALIVEFDSGGYRQVGRDDLAERSAAAVAKAMASIRDMGDKVSATVRALEHRPSEVEVTFGIRFDSEAGALLARVAAGASLEVKLVWKLDKGSADAG